MGVFELPEELQRVIDREVEKGRAESAAAFLEDAVLRLVDDAQAEQREICRVAQESTADLEAGRYATIATAEDEYLLYERMMAKLHSRK